MNYKVDSKKGEFTIYNPETGKDWNNKLFNGLSYLMDITHYGSTMSKYISNDSVQITVNIRDTSFLYLRDAKTKKYWNIGGYPSLNKISNYKCVHGQQYTKISSKCHKINASITYCIAQDDTREIWKVELKNESNIDRVIDVFAVTQFDLMGFSQPVYYHAATTTYTEFVKGINGIYNKNLNPYRPFKNCNAYIMSSEQVKAYDGRYENFIGTMGSKTKPILLEKGLDCTNSLASARERGGILENEVVLKPGETKVIYYCLGLTTSKERLIKNYKEIFDSCEDVVKNAINGYERFGNLKTNSPEPQINKIFNYWAEHQVGFCMLGKKAVRDNAQLGVAMLNFDLPLAKKTINECVIHQFQDGHAVLTWYPFLEKNIYCDTAAWLASAICEYIKETGELDYLNQEFPYIDGGKGTIYEHLKQAVNWYEKKENYGVHNLPLIYTADWNDALNIPDDKAESVFMAMLICKTYTDLIELANYIKDYEFAKALQGYKNRIIKVVNDVAYNGEYYVRAFSKFGVVGDRDSKNGGKIYLNPQCWSILGDVCPSERLESVLKSMDSMESNEGIPMCMPPYEVYDETVGRMSGMTAGIYENGGIYNQAGCFKIMADIKLRRADHALNTLLKIIPDGKYNPSSKTTTEPYVFTNCYFKHPNDDMMVGFSWQTGTSAWGIMCYYEGILGLQRGYDGLHINPCVPKTWKTFSAERTYRGNKLKIDYVNYGGEKVCLTVDGKKIEGNVVPNFDKSNKVHKILVELR